MALKHDNVAYKFTISFSGFTIRLFTDCHAVLHLCHNWHASKWTYFCPSLKSKELNLSYEWYWIKLTEENRKQWSSGNVSVNLVTWINRYIFTGHFGLPCTFCDGWKGAHAISQLIRVRKAFFATVNSQPLFWQGASKIDWLQRSLFWALAESVAADMKSVHSLIFLSRSKTMRTNGNIYVLRQKSFSN